ncbi:hypothetical protein HK104_000356 [Borealophlyctis nickersoniae]|nr:hypothetical protein HK104_000356 [Borealophlyctis nickersoniae]
MTATPTQVPSDVLKLHFDGACRSDPVRGGWGSVCYRTTAAAVSPPDTLFKISGPIASAFATSNIAGYTGLIFGLRRLLQDLISTSTNPKSVLLIILGGSELVIKQLSSEDDVINPTLQIYHCIAKSLLSNFNFLTLLHIPRSCNAKADSLATSALNSNGWRRKAATCAEFEPSSLFALQIKLGSQVTYATNDIGNIGERMTLIDAAFLLHTMGKEGMKDLRDPDPFCVVVGNHGKDIAYPLISILPGNDNAYPVIGILPSITIEITAQRGVACSKNVEFSDVLVVQNLPVPFHMSSPFNMSCSIEIMNNVFGGYLDMYKTGKGLEKELFPRSYWVHPYWSSKEGRWSSMEGRIRSTGRVTGGGSADIKQDALDGQ